MLDESASPSLPGEDVEYGVRYGGLAPGETVVVPKDHHGSRRIPSTAVCVHGYIAEAVGQRVEVSPVVLGEALCGCEGAVHVGLRFPQSRVDFDDLVAGVAEPFDCGIENGMPPEQADKSSRRSNVARVSAALRSCPEAVV